MAEARMEMARESSSLDWSLRDERRGLEPRERTLAMVTPPRGRRRQSLRLSVLRRGQLGLESARCERVREGTY